MMGANNDFEYYFSESGTAGGKIVQLNLVGNPYDYGCHVWYFAIGHGEMGIQASHLRSPSDTFVLHFRYVMGFSGLIRWRGVGLRTGDETEYEAFMSELRPAAKEPANEFLGPKYNTLFIFEAVGGSIRFIAESAIGKTYRYSGNQTNVGD